MTQDQRSPFSKMVEDFLRQLGELNHSHQETFSCIIPFRYPLLIKLGYTSVLQRIPLARVPCPNMWTSVDRNHSFSPWRIRLRWSVIRSLWCVMHLVIRIFIFNGSMRRQIKWSTHRLHRPSYGPRKKAGRRSSPVELSIRMDNQPYRCRWLLTIQRGFSLRRRIERSEWTKDCWFPVLDKAIPHWHWRLKDLIPNDFNWWKRNMKRSRMSQCWSKESKWRTVVSMNVTRRIIIPLNGRSSKSSFRQFLTE